MTETVLQVADISKSFSGVKVVANATFSIELNSIHAIIGPNGAGKTTLISLLDGALPVDSGSILFKGRNIQRLPRHNRVQLGLTRSFQITSIFPEMSVLENVALSVQAKMGASYTRMWKSARNDSFLVEPALKFLNRVRLSENAHRRAGTMSHGEHRQLEIAMALATKPTLLLLDEPMAGLGAEESSQMINLIKTLSSDHSILLIEHDMNAVFMLANFISVMVRGQIIRTGPPNVIRSDEQVRAAYLGDTDFSNA